MKVKVVVYLCQAVGAGSGGGGHVQCHGECGADPDSFLINYSSCLAMRCNVHNTCHCLCEGDSHGTCRMAEGAVCVCLSLGWDGCGLVLEWGVQDVGDSLLMASSTSLSF